MEYKNKYKNIRIPVIGYKLSMYNNDARNTHATIYCTDINGPHILMQKTGYLVDMVNFIEEMGADRFEIKSGLDIMLKRGHNTVHFDTLGAFAYTDYERAPQ